MRDWSAGERVAGYELLAELGRGGMGVVFRARELATGRELALKTLTFLDPEEVSRLQREGEALARLSHPNLLQVFGANTHEGRPYLALELVSGGSLADRLRGGERLEWRAARDLIAPLARALAAAHQAGIVHRDLKPENVLLTQGGQAKLADFGLVRLHDRTRLTETGAVLGTPLYMSPEQARGEPAGPPSDVYSLAAVLYRSLSGRTPIPPQPSMIAQLSALQSEAPARLTTEVAPAALAELLTQALAKDPSARPSAAEFAQRLEEAGATSAAPARSGRPGAALPVLLGVLVLGGLVLGVLVLGGLAGSRLPSAASPTPSVAVSRPSPSLPAEAPPYVTQAAEVRLPLGEVVGEIQTRAPRLPEWLKTLAPLSSRTVVACASRCSAALFQESALEGIPDFAAKLELVRRGHYRWIGSALEDCVGERPPTSAAGRLLRASARLGHVHDLHLVNSTAGPLAAAWAYLGWSGQLLETPRTISLALKQRHAQFGDAFPRAPGEALRQLWECEQGASDAGLRSLRQQLGSDPRQALKGYLRLWRERRDLRGDRFAEELQRCAELAALGWLQAAKHGFGVEVRVPGSDELEDDLPHVERARQVLRATLRCTDWARGRYLLALCEFPAWSPFFPQPAREFPPARGGAALVQLERALALDPNCYEALYFKASIWLTKGAPMAALKVLEQIALRCPTYEYLLVSLALRCLVLLSAEDSSYWPRCRKLYKSLGELRLAPIEPAFPRGRYRELVERYGD